MTTTKVATLLAGLLMAGSAQATLIDRGGGLIYDDALNITWLWDANYAQTSGADSDGRLNWVDAVSWTADLVYYDPIRKVNYTDWRLPTTLQPDASCNAIGIDGSYYGYNCSGSEMGRLFHVALGGVSGKSINDVHNTYYNLFENIRTDEYWSETEFESNPGVGAWSFSMAYGAQNALNKQSTLIAWAVRDGDVAAAAVPEPDTIAMFLAGLWLMGLMARHRKES